MNQDFSMVTSLPIVDSAKVDDLLQAELAQSELKIVVLDDDPTGVQTVHDVSVYTNWSEESIRAGFQETNRAFFVLTNSRSFSAEYTREVHRTIAERVAKAAKELGKEFVILCRSDSTLRGHYPLETQVLRDTLITSGIGAADGEILCPFFPEGGRYTLNNIHYVRYGEQLVPAGETEFAKDKTFGYRSSDLREYIEEKTDGLFRAEDVTCISLEELRNLKLDEIENRLVQVSDFRKVVVNAASYDDLKVFAIALYRAMKRGKRYMFRTAAGLVRVLAGISERPLLQREEMVNHETSNGGIVVVGSHTAKTTAQLRKLLTLPCVEGIEFHSEKVLEGREAFQEEIARVVALSEKMILEGITPVCFTGRKLLSFPEDTPEEALARSVQISNGVQALVGRLNVVPAFVVAKGGITSSDVGTKALAVKKATVLGQIRPGIPVWKTGEESLFPGIPYVIFPGNVGEESTLLEAVQVLTGKE